jgi:D-inositol-3-phosphate glycosyltransferase
MMIRRIAILSVHTSPLAPLGGKKTGGMNVYVRELARELGTRGIQIDVFTRRDSPETPEIDHSLGDNVRVVSITAGLPVPLDPQEVFQHLQQFAAGVIAFTTRHDGLRYDIVYSHYWLSGWVADKLREVWGTPYAQMFHTLGHMKNRIDVRMPASLSSFQPDTRVLYETQIIDNADRIIAATPAELAQLLWLYRADKRKISVVPPGVDAERFQPISQQEARSRLDIAPDAHMLLFVGRIEPLKAVDTIFYALQQLKDRPEAASNTKLAVIGGNPQHLEDNSELARLVRLAEALSISEMVDFLGAKDQQLLPLYYSASDAVIMPSDYESFGMVALEAMASGTPVIASEVGGLAYLVRDGETGYLVPVREPAVLADRIYRLITDEALQRRLGRNAAALAREYSWTHIADQLLHVFGDMLSRRRPVSAASSR